MKWLILVLFAFSVMAQQPQSRPIDRDTEQMEKIMKMRAEMHRRMMDKLLNDIGKDGDLFGDMEQLMNDMMKDSFTGFDSYAHRAQNFKSEWKESTTGRTLEITPNKPEQQLDINVANNMITIKGKTEIKTANGTQVSNFSNSFSVPGDVEATKMKMDLKNGKILVYFPFYKPTENKRKPLNPSANDVQI